MSNSTITASRLIAVLGRIGSDQDGEALSAAKMAHRMVQQAGLTWADVIRLPERASPSQTTFSHAGDREPMAFDGHRHHPPHEGSWIATVHFLFREAVRTPSRIPPDDAGWVVRRVALWRTRALHPYEAARLARIYADLTGPAGGQS